MSDDSFAGKCPTCGQTSHYWISVEDRLPEVDQETLIRIPVCSRFNIENGKYLGKGTWLGGWCDRRGPNSAYKVTHWMPLPEPPK